MPCSKRGRVAALSASGAELELMSERGRELVALPAPAACTVGDLVEIDEHGRVRVVTPFRGDARVGATAAMQVLHPRRRRGGAARARALAATRAFFAARDFIETPTPIVVPCPGMEPHIRPLAVSGERTRSYLHTSPEFAMKRLLVGGLERIYQICPVFRDEPRSPTHLVEFTMLEFYRAWADEHALMADVEQLVAQLACAQHGSTSFTAFGRRIDVAPPWPRLCVRDLMLLHAGVDPVPTADLAAACARLGVATAADDTWDDLYFRLWMERVEPKLPADRPCFVTRYPASQAALADVDTDADGSTWARRFEVYAAGLELGNAFYELTDPAVQRARFITDAAVRRDAHPDWPAPPPDEAFLGALAEGMPPSAGIALGFDRLVMLIADEPDIAFTVWQP